MDAASRGKKAADAQNYTQAITEYTAAIKSSPTSPNYHIERSKAYHKSHDYPHALEDAEKGVVFAQKRAKREFIVEAQLRRALALFMLERYGDAEFVLGVVRRMSDKEKMLPMWEKKTSDKLAGMEEGDEKRLVSVKETPDVNTDAPAETSAKQAAPAASNGTNGSSFTTAASAQTPVDKIRHEWYQNTTNIYFTLFAKGVPADKCAIDIQARSLSISFPTGNDASYDLTLEPLFAAVVPKKCIPRIMATKIEVILVKAVQGQKWSALESTDPVIGKSDSVASADSEDIKRAVLSDAPKPAGPAYPTSSKSGPKNWDALATELTKSKKKSKDDGADGNEDDWDYEKDGEGDETNAFFKKLYAGATPDVRKAMMKSFTESNGTALSTNWDEVSKGPVPTEPPDGMQARKYGE